VNASPVYLKFFVDQCVPDSAGKALQAFGHEVVYLREQIPPNSPDPLVAAVAEANGAILVSLDADFRKIARQHGVQGKQFRRLSLIKLSCRESRAPQRIQAAMSLILHEWDIVQRQGAPRLFIDIMDAVIRTVR
jgi:predicted nuclease of predicted toxin-antitoxin system